MLIFSILIEIVSIILLLATPILVNKQSMSVRELGTLHISSSSKSYNVWVYKALGAKTGSLITFCVIIGIIAIILSIVLYYYKGKHKKVLGVLFIITALLTIMPLYVTIAARFGIAPNKSAVERGGGYAVSAQNTNSLKFSGVMVILLSIFAAILQGAIYYKKWMQLFGDNNASSKTEIERGNDGFNEGHDLAHTTFNSNKETKPEGGETKRSDDDWPFF